MLGRLPVTGLVTHVSRTQGATQKFTHGMIRTQVMSKQTSSLRKLRVKNTTSIKERLMAPAGDGAFTMGKAVVAGTSAAALGMLCYYGAGLSNEVGAIDKAALWPDIVKARIRDTYLYFGSSLIFTAGSAVAVARTPALMNLMMKSGWVSLVVTIGAMIGTSMICRSIPYQEGFGKKQLAWMLHTGVVGAVIAPMTLLGGPIMIRAAVYTAGVVAGLSTLAVCAPSEKFLNMGGPLAMGFGAVFMASIGSAFLPPTTALGAGMYSIALYGGLALFSMFLLYDTQKIVKRAETHPTYGVVPYDPVNNSISIYMDTINIFIRIATILAGGGNKRR